MINQAKNKLHLMNSLLLQQPIFNGLVMLLPFVDRNVNDIVDLVRENGMATFPDAGAEWATNEYGPCIRMTSNFGDTYTGCPSSKFYMDNFTFMFWGATTDTSSNKIYGLGFYSSASLSAFLGRRSNNPALVIKTAADFSNVNGSAPGHNDGAMHCFCGVSSPQYIKIYVDGEEADTDNATEHEQGDANLIRVGGVTDVAWPGTMSLAAVWNRALSPAEVYELYRMGPALTILQDNFDINYCAAISAGAPAFKAAWAFNSNQVL